VGQRALDPIFGRAALALGARCVEGDGARYSFAFAEAGRDGLAELSRRCPSARLGELLTVELDELLEQRDTAEAACLLAAAEAWSAQRPEPEIMGVVNVTPDSFSDGGEHLEASRAIEHGRRLAAQGATWLDVGGESTRPGAAPVPLEEELRRVLPVIEGLVRADVARVSVDTRKAEVARAALDLGAAMVNDVGAGLDDPAMLPLLAERGAEYCLMHRQGSIADMQRAPSYVEPVAEVTEFLRSRAAACLEAGIARERLYLDPGIGFGKTLEHNLELLSRLAELRSLGLPLLLGVSRKSFIGHIRSARGLERPEDRASSRLGGTAAAISFCVRVGAKVLRVHDVAVMAEAAAVSHAISAVEPPRPKPRA
jgi:dihydropteroate synthase